MSCHDCARSSRGYEDNSTAADLPYLLRRITKVSSKKKKVMDPAHNCSDQALLAAENEELRDLCCYLDDDRVRLKQSVRKWKERYYQLCFRSQCANSGPIKRQRSSELKDTAKQVSDVKRALNSLRRGDY